MKRLFRGYGIALALIIITNIFKIVSIIFICHLKTSVSCKNPSLINSLVLKDQVVKNNSTSAQTTART